MICLRKIFTLLLITMAVIGLHAQDKQSITLEDIWKKGTFSPRYVSGYLKLPSGSEYARIVHTSDYRFSFVVRYHFESGAAIDTIINGKLLAQANGLDKFYFGHYELSADGKFALIPLNEQNIYRHSSDAEFKLADLAKNTLKSVGKGRTMYATFSPTGTHVAWVEQNNLFVMDLKKRKIRAVTKDGKKNEIINGAVDWVYEEEFAMDRGYQWNADGSKLAFYRFDERRVKEWQMPVYGTLYPHYDRFKYPKAGEENSIVDVYLYDLKKKKRKKLETGSENDQYLPRIQWTKDPERLSIQRLNRLQNHWELLMVDAGSGKPEVVWEEKDETYVDIPDQLFFLNDGKHFVMKSERDGWWHLYLHKVNGPQVYQITKGDFEVDEILGVDEARGKLYYTSTEMINTLEGANHDRSVERHLYSIDLDGKNKSMLSKTAGSHSANFSSDFSFYLHTWSNVQQPPFFEICRNDGTSVRVIEDNQALIEKLKSYQISPLRFHQMEVINESGRYALNYYLIFPESMATADSARKFPMLMHVYGGPGSQQVRNQWMGANYFWHQMLANTYGYVIAVVDNRGTGGKGAHFKKLTYRQLGRYETEDQISVAKTLPQLYPIDKSRIGIWGWSYGGYMSSLCITKGASTFKTAIAVAPVTNWRFYDNIYTERYMSTPQLNGAAYDNNSPLSHVDSIRGNYLIIHGTADDNVHFENAVSMVDEMVKKNIRFDSEFYPNRNHGIYGGNTRLHLYRRMTEYILDKL